MALAARQSRVSVARASRPQVASRRAIKVSAKYGEGSKYVDLKDIENTTGAWDLYGVDEKKRYPALQETFFQRATDPVTRREALNGFVALSGIGAIVLYGLKGSKDAQLPIVAGPREGKTENGKGGSNRSRL